MTHDEAVAQLQAAKRLDWLDYLGRLVDRASDEHYAAFHPSRTAASIDRAMLRQAAIRRARKQRTRPPVDLRTPSQRRLERQSELARGL